MRGVPSATNAMRRTNAVALLVLVLSGACELNRPAEGRERITAASALTHSYARSALAPWYVRGRAAAADCRVLFVETSVVMDDAMVEALHYGAGAYDVYRGGVEQFSRDHNFRGVAYRDFSGRTWVFGAVNPAEALTPCR